MDDILPLVSLDLHDFADPDTGDKMDPDTGDKMDPDPSAAVYHIF